MNIQQFLQQVGVHIESKEAREHVAEELNVHLQDAKSSYVRQGEAEEVAEQKAVEAMGSSLQLGRKMNGLHKPKVDWLLIGLFIAALGLGFLPIWLENAVYGHDLGHLYGMKAAHIAICAAVVVGLYFMDYRKLWYGRGIFMIVLFFAVFFYGEYANYRVNGESVLQLGPIELTEIIFIPLFIVAWGILLSNKQRPLYVFWSYFLLNFSIIILSLSVKIALLYTIISFSQFLVSYYTRKEKWLSFGAFGLLFTMLIVYVASKSYYFMIRFKVLLDPEAYADTAGYILLLIEGVREAAGWTGSSQFVELPNSYTDFALVSVLQGLGYGGVLLVGIVLFSLLAKLLWNSLVVELPFGKQLIVGTSVFYGFVLVYTVAMLFGLVPISGLGVPFVSYGFTDLLVFAILIGFVLSVYRRKSLTERMRLNSRFSDVDAERADEVTRELTEQEAKREAEIRLMEEQGVPKWRIFLMRCFE